MTATDKKSSIEKLSKLIDNVNVAMITTLKVNGEFYSRPMNTMDFDEDGNLFFFSDEHTPDVHDIKVNNRVSVTYTNPENNTYIALNGRLYLEQDQEKINQLWVPACKAWFPEGKTDPNLTLLKVEVLKAEYWDTAESDMVVMFNMLKAIVKGETYDQGEHKKITLKD
ncbi:pyridoxamine 5'-phosphate oxidase [Pedobacter psychrophilus]|uniref:Pyridoxamine 5'-phosphate oxidase n=1 Tax=Pedobacter psychrophilus TaxID=1826909 RepID=A0A179DM86_9SPHI|nr:pyridoxamine 5'-phosphate oxidase family protein [Pedobacter psychrophilus]OAQ42176.1 pyridoxamine 5'-phosphate oxidase [Pedobacter psychrophilus]